ncbi:unnamed protein product [Trichobilharzia szidati]|nr:unnamed protein product [Trichobilharzia szidati]
MKKLKPCYPNNSSCLLRHQKKYPFNEEFQRLSLQSTSNHNGNRSSSSNSRKTKSTSVKSMYKTNQPSSLKSCQKKVVNNTSPTDKPLTNDISGIRIEQLPKPFSYSRHIALPFSERALENNCMSTNSSINFPTSVQSNRCTYENSWSNLWRSGLPEQKLTVWLPRRFNDQDDERSQWNSHNVKLHKHSFPDLNFAELDNRFTWKSIQKSSPQINVNRNSYWTPNAYYNVQNHKIITNSNNNNSSSSTSTNNSKLLNTSHRNGEFCSNYPDNSKKLTVMGNSYPVTRPPDIKEKTLAQLSLIRKEENCTTSVDSVANVKGYMDPMAGAPTDFLNRINELVKLQEATKRWERTRCRRRVKRKTLPNSQTLNQVDSQN